MQQDVIIIVRHGLPALSRKVWLTWSGYADWWGQYDAGGLALTQRVPAKVKQYAEQADIIMSSPLRRAMETARIASGREPDIVDPELVEAALPPPRLGPIKFRPKTWGTFSRIAWFVGWSGGLESHKDARLRARRMSRKIEVQAAGGKMVFVTGHGWYNRMLKGELKANGWKCVTQTGDLHWSHRRFERPSNFEAKK